MLRIGDFNVKIVESANDVWRAFSDFENVEFDGFALLDRKFNLTDSNGIPRICDLMCDISPRTNISVESILYDSDEFTRKNPLNMLSSSVVHNGAKIASQDLAAEYKEYKEYKATFVFMRDPIRLTLNEMYRPLYEKYDSGDLLEMPR